MNFVDIVFASLLANHLLFFHFLGLGEFLTRSDGHDLRRTMVLLVLLLLASVLFWVPDHFLLEPWGLEFLRTLVLVAALWLVTSVYELFLRSFPGPWPQAREFLVHSLLVGGAVLVGTSSPDLLEVVVASLAVALGYGGALVVLKAVSHRLARERIPVIAQGLPLQLATLGLVWLVLRGMGMALGGPGS